MLLLEQAPLVRVCERQRSDSDAGEAPLHAARRPVLLLWTAVVALSHFDRGIATVAAMDVLGAWHGDAPSLTFRYVASLLAWHSLGLGVGSLIAGGVVQRLSGRGAIVAAMAVNSSMLLVCGLSADASYWLMSLSRLVSGGAASVPLVYLPLWVDEYSPSEAHGRWMSVLQLGGPSGLFLGVLVTGLVVLAGRPAVEFHWKHAMLLQAVVFAPLIVRVASLPSDVVNVCSVATVSARVDSLAVYPIEGSQLSQFRIMLLDWRDKLHIVSRNPLASALTASLCWLHFTGASLVLWSAPYLAFSRGGPAPLAALFLVALALLCLPLLGTYIGASLCNRLDGFKSGHHAAALRVACLAACLAVAAAPTATAAAGAFGGRLAAVVVWLIGAGAFLPVAVGTLMTSMPSYLRSFSAMSSLFFFHTLGFAAAPLAAAVCMSCFNSPLDGLAFGVSLSLWSTAPALGLLLVAYIREPKTVLIGGMPSTGSRRAVASVDDLSFGDVGYELARRRMTTAPL